MVPYFHMVGLTESHNFPTANKVPIQQIWQLLDTLPIFDLDALVWQHRKQCFLRHIPFSTFFLIIGYPEALH